MSTITPSPAGPSDRVRQIVIVIAGALAFAVAAWGAGAFGGPGMDEVANGAYGPDASVLAPASTAFSIWSLIYIGLALFMIYQALPSRGSDPRLRAVGWWVLASLVLNAVWIAAAHVAWLWGSVVIILALVAVLWRIVLLLIAHAPQSWRDVVTTDIPVGLYLGWVMVATVANFGAAFADEQAGEARVSSAWVAGSIAAFVLVAVLAFMIARRVQSRPGVSISAGLAITWGLMWIAIGRAEGQPESLGLMWAAGLAACVTFAVTFAVRDIARGDRRSFLTPG